MSSSEIIEYIYMYLLILTDFYIDLKKICNYKKF